jgi:hypothetical protein
MAARSTLEEAQTSSAAARGGAPILVTWDDALRLVVRRAFDAAATRIEVITTLNVARVASAPALLLDLRARDGASRIGRSLVRLLAVERTAPPTVAIVDDAAGLSFANDFGLGAVAADACEAMVVEAVARAAQAGRRPRFVRK